MKKNELEGVAPPPPRAEVWKMFDRIAPAYDRLNRLLSLGRDAGWRRRVASRLPDREGLRILDLAAGTGDLLLSLAAARKSASLTGMDMSLQMLALANDKANAAVLGDRVSWVQADIVSIPLPDRSQDVVTIAFGIRNVADTGRTLGEMHRVLAPGGKALVLEFSLPRGVLTRGLFLLYLRHVVPALGGWLSGDRGAYRYLNRTIETFPYGDAFLGLLRAAGFEDVSARPMTGGVVTLYEGTSRQ